MRVVQTHEMDFLHEQAGDKGRVLAEQERDVLMLARGALEEADEVIVWLGGKAGRLGESVVGTGLLEGMLQVLSAVGKEGVVVQIMVEPGIEELFEERRYQEGYWAEIRVVALAEGGERTETIGRLTRGQRVVSVDLHGGHDGMPFMSVLRDEEGGMGGQGREITMLERLFRVGVRSYAQRGPERRYADFMEEMFMLPSGMLAGEQVQPALRLGDEDRGCYPQFAQEFGLDEEALQVVCFFQSVVQAKCYERWQEVMLPLCEWFAHERPGETINFLLACGPEEDLPESVKRDMLVEEFAVFTGVNGNARVVVRATPSLRDLAVLISGAKVVLANDTGPGHMAGALCVPVVTPYLPGNIYSKRVWSSTLWHHGVTVEPNPYSYQQLEAAILWGNPTYINSVPPEELVEAAVRCLCEEI